MEYAYDFGQTLKSLRKQRNMTQTELGILFMYYYITVYCELRYK